jgi:hypothetical protein
MAAAKGDDQREGENDGVVGGGEAGGGVLGAGGDGGGAESS